MPVDGRGDSSSFWVMPVRGLTISASSWRTDIPVMGLALGGSSWRMDMPVIGLIPTSS